MWSQLYLPPKDGIEISPSKTTSSFLTTLYKLSRTRLPFFTRQPATTALREPVRWNTFSTAASPVKVSSSIGGSLLESSSCNKITQFYLRPLGILPCIKAWSKLSDKGGLGMNLMCVQSTSKLVLRTMVLYININPFLVLSLHIKCNIHWYLFFFFSNVIQFEYGEKCVCGGGEGGREGRVIGGSIFPQRSRMR